MKTISLAEAKAQGLTRYYTGKACPKGHMVERWVACQTCVECKKAYRKAWYVSNKEHRAETCKAWRLANKEREAEIGKAWRLANPDRRAEIKSARRARKLRAAPPWLTPAHRKQIAALHAACPPGHTLDHIVPLKGLTPEGYRVSGLHVPWNLQALPAGENFGKCNRMTTRCYEIACSLVQEMPRCPQRDLRL